MKERFTTEHPWQATCHTSCAVSIADSRQSLQQTPSPLGVLGATFTPFPRPIDPDMLKLVGPVSPKGARWMPEYDTTVVAALEPTEPDPPPPPPEPEPIPPPPTLDGDRGDHPRARPPARSS